MSKLKNNSILGLLLLISTFSFSQISIATPTRWLTTETSFNFFEVADLNNDKIDEWIMGSSLANADPQDSYYILIYSQDVNKKFTVSQKIKVDKSKAVSALAIGDLNNDGLLDIVFNQKDSLTLYTQKVNGSFVRTMELLGETSADYLEIGDLNNDGLNDIAMSNFKTKMTVFYQNPNHSFTIKELLAPRGGYNKLIIADVNADGKKDVILKVGQLENGIAVYFQNAGAQLSDYVFFDLPPPQPFESWSIGGIAVRDLNNDGKNDILIPLSAGYATSKLMALIQKNNNTFERLFINVDGERPDNVSITDLDCDGKNEIVVMCNGYYQYLIFEQNTGGKYVEISRNKTPYSTFYHDIVETYVGKDRRKDLAVLGLQEIILLENNSTNPTTTRDTVAIKTQSTVKDSFNIVEKTITQRTDTVQNKVITEIKEQSKIKVFEVVQVKTDTFKIKISNICSDLIRDTLIASLIKNDTTLKRTYSTFTVRFDTLIMKDTIKKDTIINNQTISNNVNIYPNPCSDYYNVKIDNLKKGEKAIMTVFSYNGILMKIETLLNSFSEIETKDLIDGLYIVRVEYGKQVFHRKLTIFKYD
jgi:Secretion system C-terminal sorting domain/FG-GAP-like repeat